MPQNLERCCGSVSGEGLTGEGLAEAAGRAASEVLETMFFAEAVAVPCQHGAWLDRAVSAHIRFEGSHRGEMRLSVSKGAADSIAGAFLGLEPLELTEQLGCQVMLELANILCGAILSQLWPESKLALGAPEMAAGEEPRGKALHCCLELPEGMLALWVLGCEAVESE